MAQSVRLDLPVVDLRFESWRCYGLGYVSGGAFDKMLVPGAQVQRHAGFVFFYCSGERNTGIPFNERSEHFGQPEVSTSKNRGGGFLHKSVKLPPEKAHLVKNL